MFLRTTTDTGVVARRVVNGRYTIHLGEVRIGRVFGDYEIGFTAYDTDGATLGRHESLQDAMGAVHDHLIDSVEREVRRNCDEECVWASLHATAPVPA
jgi:hypothetical protein